MKKLLLVVLVFCFVFIFTSCEKEEEAPNWSLPYTLVWEGEIYTHYNGGILKANLDKYIVGEVTATVNTPKENGESNFAKPNAGIADFYGKILAKTDEGWYVMDFADSEKESPVLPQLLNHKDTLYFWTGKTVDYTPAEEELYECWSLVEQNSIPTEWGEANFSEIINCGYVLQDEDILILVDGSWYLMEQK